jgi:ferredoxin-NADP reductase
MAGTAVLGRLIWHVATVVSLRDETASARTIAFHIDGWPGHEAGQHVDVRLTAADGYTATRSYSIASRPGGDTLEITVEVIENGEVSPYLVHEIAVGDKVEVRGPIGGWFVWRPVQTEPVQLIGGGSGLVPLMSMIRARVNSENTSPFRLLYSVRHPESVLYANELEQLAMRDDGVEIDYAYTRTAPPGSKYTPKRIDRDIVAMTTWPASRMPTSYVCGPTPFVEAVANLLRAAGYDAARIRTERFGPTGGQT